MQENNTIHVNYNRNSEMYKKAKCMFGSNPWIFKLKLLFLHIYSTCKQIYKFSSFIILHKISKDSFDFLTKIFWSLPTITNFDFAEFTFFNNMNQPKRVTFKLSNVGFWSLISFALWIAISSMLCWFKIYRVKNFHALLFIFIPIIPGKYSSLLVVWSSFSLLKTTLVS